jgi:uncharacterized protein YtpQ (UPF0354 family)
MGRNMTEMKCPACGTSMDFKSVISSTNPASIKCPGCVESIKINYLYAVPITVFVLIMAFGVWNYLEHLEASFKQSLLAMIALGLVVEYLYFEALKRGIVPSSLTAERVINEQNNCANSNSYKIVPRVKNSNYLNVIQNVTNGVEESIPVTEPLVGDLVLTYAIDLGESYVALSKSSAKDFNVSMDNVRQTAEVNALSSLKGIQVNPHGKVFELACSDNMMACSILFPALWDQIEGEIGGPVIIGVPHRDTVLYAHADDKEAIEELISAMARFDFEETHALSKLLFVRDNNEWRKFQA